jgi:hypothetical protein
MGLLAVQPVASRYTNCDIQAPLLGFMKSKALCKTG